MGILDWTCKEIDQIDIKTRKTLAMSGSFCPNSDADRLYFHRKDGGSGIRAIRTIYESRIISIHQHLRNVKDKSETHEYVYESEDNNIVRAGYELLQRNEIEDKINEKTRTISTKFSTKEQNLKTKKYSNKKVHSYFYNKLQSDIKIDTNISNRRSTDKSMTSQNTSSTKPTKYLINKRQKEAGKEATCNTKCRSCKHSTEDVNHIISSCPEMSVRYYLPVRYDVVAKTVLKALILKTDPTDKFKHQQDPKYVYKVKDCEFWWNLSIKTATKLKHNKPDIVAWDRAGKICKIIEISCPADVNITKKVEEKLNNYGPLIRNLQMMYPHYKFQMVPIVIGALCYVPKYLEIYINQLGFNKIETEILVRKLQNISASGTVKIYKTFLSFHDS